MTYEYLDHTADVGFIVRTSSLEMLFEEAAEALINIMTPIENVECREKRNIELESETLEDLLYDYLSEFLYLLDAENLIFRNFKVRVEQKENGWRLSAEICGEKVYLQKHIFESYVKAITYHALEVKRTQEGWLAKVIVDI